MTDELSAATPLAGLRVLDLTRNIAGPVTTMILGDLGADVVKVEAPGSGDDARGWGPPFADGMSGMFLSVNRNKRSVVLDLADPTSRPVMNRLVEESDIVVESFRRGSLDKLGYSYDWARSRNRRVIYASVTAYGGVGPLRDEPGYDPLMQAFGGLMAVTGEHDGEPVRVGVSIIDIGTGLWTAIAVLSAVHERHATGAGRCITSSLFETSLSWMAPHLINFWLAGQPAERFGSGSSVIVPYQAFPTLDGHVVIAAGNDRLFSRLASVLGHEEWTRDPRFETNAVRVKHRAAIVPLIEGVTRPLTADALLAGLRDAGVPCARIRQVEEVANDVQASALGIFQPMLGDGPQPRLVGLPFMIDGRRPPLRQNPPRLGEHTQGVLGELGAGVHPQDGDEG